VNPYQFAHLSSPHHAQQQQQQNGRPNQGQGQGQGQNQNQNQNQNSNQNQTSGQIDPTEVALAVTAAQNHNQQLHAQAQAQSQNQAQGTPDNAGPKKRGRKPTKEKKIRDPNAPKRPPSAYIMFQNDIRDQIKAQVPGIQYKDILNNVAARWKGMTPDQKKVSDGL
jgi:hypothetical protein